MKQPRWFPLVLLTLLFWFKGIHSNVVCVDVLNDADTNGDGKLTRQEYVEAIHFMTTDSINDLFFPPFENLSLELQRVFENISCQQCLPKTGLSSCCKGESAVIDIDKFNVKETCNKIQTTLMDKKEPAPLLFRQLTPGPTPTLVRCYVAITIADDGNARLNQTEYTNLINWLEGGRRYQGFDGLPLALQNNYLDLASPTDGQIDVFGARPGQIPKQEQEDFLLRVCRLTGRAINEATPRLTLARCYAAMTTADTEPQDNILTPREYVTFVNQISQTTTASLFSRLDPALRIHYDRFDTPALGGIDVRGSKSGARPTPAQREFLDRLCTETDLAVYLALHPMPPSPTISPIITTPMPIITTPMPIITTPMPIITTPMPIITASPTAPPTAQPTGSPTAQPTTPPTSSPTASPTPGPTP